MKRLSRLAYGCVGLACALWAADRLSAQNLVRERMLPRTLLDRGDFVCGTQSLRDLQLVRTRAVQPLPDGGLLSFEQSPPLLTPDYAGDFGLQRVLVVGDFPSLQFRRADRDNPDHIETWPRTTTMGSAAG